MTDRFADGVTFPQVFKEQRWKKDTDFYVRLFVRFRTEDCAACFIEHVQRAALKISPFGVQGPFFFLLIYDSVSVCMRKY